VNNPDAGLLPLYLKLYDEALPDERPRIQQLFQRLDTGGCAEVRSEERRTGGRAPHAPKKL